MGQKQPNVDPYHEESTIGDRKIDAPLRVANAHAAECALSHSGDDDIMYADMTPEEQDTSCSGVSMSETRRCRSRASTAGYDRKKST